MAPPTRSISRDFRVSADDVGVHRFDPGAAPTDKLRRMSATGGDMGHLDLCARKEELAARPALLDVGDAYSRCYS